MEKKSVVETTTKKQNKTKQNKIGERPRILTIFVVNNLERERERERELEMK